LLLRSDSFVNAAELALNPVDLAPGRRALPIIEFLRCPRHPPLDPVHDRGHHLQVAPQLCGWPGRSGLARLPLRFEKQFGCGQNPFANGGRALPPGRVQKASFARFHAVSGEDGGHPLAIVEALPRHRHQKLHRHLRRNLSLAHLLLDGLRENLHQGQPPRHPTHAAIEPAG
jgi:hypothetical protein